MLTGDDVPQVFHAFGQVWQVEEALRRVHDRQPETLVIDQTLAEWALFLTEGESIANRDLTLPILVIPLPADIFGSDPGCQVMDGWHRIAQAIQEGLYELPAHFLSSEDERACRSADEWDIELVEVLRETHEPWHPVRPRL